MVLLDISATGEENVIEQQSGNQMNDLEYRRKQLLKLQDAVIDMEDLASGVSITDLTLTDFRIDAASRPSRELRRLTKWPLALFGVTRFDQNLASEGLDPGAVFLLHVRDDAFSFSKSYPLAPYVLAYVTDDGALAHPVEEPKRALDVLRRHCLDRVEPDHEVLTEFEKATRQGRSMKHYRNLLDAAVRAASGRAEEKLAASIFSAGPSLLGADASVPGLESIDVVAWVAVIP